MAEIYDNHYTMNLAQMNEFYRLRGGYDVGPVNTKTDNRIYKVTDPQLQFGWLITDRWELDETGCLLDATNPYLADYREVSELSYPDRTIYLYIFCGHWDDQRRLFTPESPESATHIMFLDFTSQHFSRGSFSANAPWEWRCCYRQRANITDPASWSQTGGGDLAYAKSYGCAVQEMSLEYRKLALTIAKRQAEQRLQHFTRFQSYAANADQKWRQMFATLQPAATERGLQLDLKSWPYSATLSQKDDSSSVEPERYFYNSEDFLSLSQKLSKIPFK